MDHDPPDRDLVESTLGGDTDAFGELADRYYRMISVLAYQKTGHRTDAEDLVQEALVRAFRALPSLRDPNRFAAWLYNITLKLCIDWSRRRERRSATLSMDNDALAHAESGRHRRTDPSVGAELEQAEEHQRVLGAVGHLPDKYGVVVTLRYVHRMSYREIADHLGEPPGTIANRLHRATRMLQEKLGVRLNMEGRP